MGFIRKYLIFFLVWVFPALYSQLPQGGRPFPFSSMKSAVKPIVLSGFDLQKAIGESLSEEAVSGKKPFRFAWNYSLDFSPENSGKWTEMPDGTRVWRIHLSSPGAYAVNVDFSRYRLKPGSMIFIYAPSQSTFLGGFNQKNNNESQSLPTSFVSGDELVVELQISPGITDYGELKIGSLSHAYIDVFNTSDRYFGASGDCNVDVNCTEGDDWQIVKKAVCRIIFKTGSSTELCTGTLVNNVRQDTIPYLLTANHCIRFVTQAQSAVFYFGHEVDTCGKQFISSSYSLAGSELLATSDSIDFSLLRLSETPPEEHKPYYAGWSVSKIPATSVVCIHHPQGDVKKISIDNGPVTAEYQNPIPLDLHWLYDESLPQAFWRVIKWETGTTEGGSSGSPLFNQNQLIVGNLTGGQADCSNSVNDYYSKFHMGWDYYSNYSKQLKHWLDPESTGITNLVGFNPYGQNIIQYASRFSVFPNPASSQVTFETDSLDISGGVLSVYSLTGKKMAQYNIKESTRLSFNVSSFNQGMYILEFRKGEIYERKRLVVINPLK